MNWRCIEKPIADIAHNNMHAFATYILLLAVLTVQTFGSVAFSNASCGERMCQCSASSVQADSCCCSTENANRESVAAKCCNGTAAHSLASPESPRATHICDCGCNDRSEPIPAPTENRTFELLRSVSHEAVSTLDNSVTEPSPIWARMANHNFYGGLSAQPLFCLWLI